MLKGAEQYQSIVRVPFIWADPHCGQHQATRSDALASTMDIGAHRARPRQDRPAIGMQAISFLPVVERGTPVRDCVLSNTIGQRRRGHQ